MIRLRRRGTRAPSPALRDKPVRVAVTNTVVLNGGDAAIALAIVESLERIAPRATVELHDAQPDVAARYYPALTFKRSLASTLRSRRGSRLIRELDRARLLAAARLLRRPGTSSIVSMICRSHEKARLANYRGIDLIVSTGGTYLVEIYDISARLFELELAQAMGVPVVFFTQSLGPFNDARNRRRLKRIFSRSPLVLLRDAQSLHHLREIGVPDRALHVAADAVFAREAQHSLSRADTVGV
jgi:colanic acid/amylovoran biosynthesis protein